MSHYELGAPIVIEQFSGIHGNATLVAQNAVRYGYTLLEAADVPPYPIGSGLSISLIAESGQTLSSKVVMRHGAHLPRPFYEKRIERAINTVTSFAGTLALNRIISMEPSFEAATEL